MGMAEALYQFQSTWLHSHTIWAECGWASALTSRRTACGCDWGEDGGGNTQLEWP